MIKRTKIWFILTVAILTLGTAAYAAADRYLIRHVEVADVHSYSTTIQATQSLVVSDGAEKQSDSTTEVSYQTSDSTEEITSAESTSIETSYDDWNYQSDTLKISINKVTTGSASDTVTYYVADIQINDATQLQKAFADDQFGRNITADTSDIAAAHDSILAINGDYYGFRSDGIVIQNGVIYRDDGARTGLAFYRDGTMQIYDETTTTAQQLLDAGVWNTLSFGPALLDDGLFTDELDAKLVDTNIGNHPISGNQPRTGVGIIDANHYVFVVVDGRSKSYSRGVSLQEFAQIFKDLGCTEAYNNDGGGSSTMVFMGNLVNNPRGKNSERATSDILYVTE
jgi:exopolysaccharide biosynthesis protein